MKVVFDARVHLNYYSGISRYIICLLEAYLQEFPQEPGMIRFLIHRVSDGNWQSVHL